MCCGYLAASLTYSVDASSIFPHRSQSKEKCLQDIAPRCPLLKVGEQNPPQLRTTRLKVISTGMFFFLLIPRKRHAAAPVWKTFFLAIEIHPEDPWRLRFQPVSSSAWDWPASRAEVSCSVMISALGWLLSPCISHLILTHLVLLPMDFDKAQCRKIVVQCGVESGRPMSKSVFWHCYLWPWATPWPLNDLSSSW